MSGSIQDTFFEECEELLEATDEGLSAIEGGDHDPEVVNAVFRAVHSIKGGAGAPGINRMNWALSVVGLEPITTDIISAGGGGGRAPRTY